MTDTPKKHVLVVEDESALLFALKAELTHAGYEVDAALSGEEGLNKAKSEKPAVIILDLLLPGMGGFDVLGKLKEDTETKTIPVLIVSNLAGSENVKKGKAMGAVDYIVKTEYSLERVVGRIKDAINAAAS